VNRFVYVPDAIGLTDEITGFLAGEVIPTPIAGALADDLIGLQEMVDDSIPEWPPTTVIGARALGESDTGESPRRSTQGTKITGTEFDEIGILLGIPTREELGTRNIEIRDQ
jgi:hypothetical protein